MTKKERTCEELIMLILKCDLKILRELNCKTLANIYGVNRSYISRIFNECKRSYLSEFIKLIKLMRCALFMVEKRDIKVKEISDLFGYCRVGYFIKSFKNHFGITPGEFLSCIWDMNQCLFALKKYSFHHGVFFPRGTKKLSFFYITRQRLNKWEVIKKPG